MIQYSIIILTLISLTFSTLSSCQIDKEKKQNHAISRDSLTTNSTISDYQPLIARLTNNSDRDIFFIDTTETGKICSQHLDYLGEIQNQKGETTFKIMTIQTEWGLNCRLTTRILVYSKTDDYLGNYYTDGILPTQIMDNGLLFDGLIIGDFSNGIPDSLQISHNFWTTFEK